MSSRSRSEIDDAITFCVQHRLSGKINEYPSDFRRDQGEYFTPAERQIPASHFQATDRQPEARTQERRKVTQIDLEKLFNLWVEHYDRLREEAQRKLPLKPIYFLAPE